MRKIALALSAVCLLVGFNHAALATESAPAPLNPGVTVAQLAQQVPIHWVSVAQIENSLLGRAPIAVGFDIDDTVCCFQAGFLPRAKRVFSG
ncbi:Class B acid phosphatase precursor [Cedecea neteri]|uniref:Class B acid phosphatase n=1 Tax=Cedecea neteri TaxID=158822 RepID=A0A2X2T1J6_9ENTR|nr:Class B acid phosphatase precursor [Cedecea neteri]